MRLTTSSKYNISVRHIASSQEDCRHAHGLAQLTNAAVCRTVRCSINEENYLPRLAQPGVSQVGDGRAAAVIGPGGTCRPTKQVSEKVRSPPGASMPSIGNNRANAISENEPSYEPDCESNYELRYHIP